MPITPGGDFMLAGEIKAHATTLRHVYGAVMKGATEELRGCNDPARRDFLMSKKSEAAAHLARADQLEGCLRD